jgi:DNA-binding MarR family transcriptional regulator
MQDKEHPGLGELLRYVGELVEQGAAEHYETMSLDYRPRYTSVLRALAAGAGTVTQITARTHLTQGAISQTVALLEQEGLVERSVLDDARKSAIRLTPKGRTLVNRLEQHWAVTFHAIAALETEIGHPLRRVLADTARALEQQGFSVRLSAARALMNRGGKRHAD